MDAAKETNSALALKTLAFVFGIVVLGVVASVWSQRRNVTSETERFDGLLARYEKQGFPYTPEQLVAKQDVGSDSATPLYDQAFDMLDDMVDWRALDVYYGDQIDEGFAVKEPPFPTPGAGIGSGQLLDASAPEPLLAGMAQFAEFLAALQRAGAAGPKALRIDGGTLSTRWRGSGREWDLLLLKGLLRANIWNAIDQGDAAKAKLGVEAAFLFAECFRVPSEVSSGTFYLYLMGEAVLWAQQVVPMVEDPDGWLESLPVWSELLDAEASPGAPYLGFQLEMELVTFEQIILVDLGPSGMATTLLGAGYSEFELLQSRNDYLEHNLALLELLRLPPKQRMALAITLDQASSEYESTLIHYQSGDLHRRLESYQGVRSSALLLRLGGKALEFYDEKNRWPNSLEELAPDFPKDPRTELGFTFQPDEFGITLSSRGADTKRDPDLSWRIENP